MGIYALECILLSSMNAIALILYDMSIFNRISGHLVSVVSLAMLPSFMSRLSAGNVKVKFGISVAVSVSTVVMIMLRRRLYSILDAGWMWIMPLASTLSAFVVILVSELKQAEMTFDRSVMVTCRYTRTLLTGILYFLVFVLFQMLSALTGLFGGSALSEIQVFYLSLMLILFSGMLWKQSATVSCEASIQKIDCQMPSLPEAASAVPVRGVHREYEAIYKRLNSYFDDGKPFLDSSLSIAEVARILYTNKAYLSRTINLYTGSNFCQYVNRHRIHYAVELFRSDSSLKVTDLSEQSGFRSVNSFSTAFRLYMNMTPGEWCRRNRSVIQTL